MFCSIYFLIIVVNELNHVCEDFCQRICSVLFFVTVKFVSHQMSQFEFHGTLNYYYYIISIMHLKCRSLYPSHMKALDQSARVNIFSSIKVMKLIRKMVQ